MPRPTRIEPAGVSQHVIQRGNNRSACFFSDIDRRFYLKCLAEAAARRGCAIHAYVLMSNHVHLLATPSEAGSISSMMQDLGRKYVRTLNKIHGRTGTLWEGRFRSNMIDTDTYLLACHRYIELNPVRAGVVSSPSHYGWSSHSHYTGARPDRLVSEHAVYQRLGANTEERRSAFASLFAAPIDEHQVEKLRTAVNRGWALGSTAFVDALELSTGQCLSPGQRGRRRRFLDDDAETSPAQADILF